MENQAQVKGKAYNWIKKNYLPIKTEKKAGGEQTCKIR